METTPSNNNSVTDNTESTAATAKSIDTSKSAAADALIGSVHSKVLDEERNKANLNKFSFYFTWFFAAALVIMLLYVACQGVEIVKAEIEFANQYIQDNQKQRLPVKDEHGNEAKLHIETKHSDAASVISSFSSAYGKSLLFLGVVLSILTTAFVTLALSASKMFLPRPAEKLDPPSESGSFNYPPLDWVVKLFESASNKK